MSKRAGAVAFMIKVPIRGTKNFRLAATRGGWATRQGARNAFVKSLGRSFTWKKCYRGGCRVVMVDITEMI